MRKLFAVVMSAAMIAAFTPIAEAQTNCPPEVAQAKELLAKKGTTAREQSVQAPRSLAGARQSVQAPRDQNVQAPRAAAGAKASGSISQATQLVKDAEMACKAGDAKTAKDKADAAISILK